jgi:hypothetical protein
LISELSSKIGSRIASTIKSTSPPTSRITSGPRIPVSAFYARGDLGLLVRGRGVEHRVEPAALLARRDQAQRDRRKLAALGERRARNPGPRALARRRSGAPRASARGRAVPTLSRRASSSGTPEADNVASVAVARAASDARKRRPNSGSFSSARSRPLAPTRARRSAERIADRERDEREQEPQPERTRAGRQRDQRAREQRQLLPDVLEHVHDLRHDVDQQAGDDRDRDDGQEDRDTPSAPISVRESSARLSL